MSFRKGQFSTYLKPIVVVILAVLLISLLTSTLQFGGETQKERGSYEFDAQAPKIKNRILECLSVSENYSSSGNLINYSKLREWNRNHKYMEPKCSEDFEYGWNATITAKYIETDSLVNREKLRKPVGYLPGDSDGVKSYLEAHNFSNEMIAWKNLTDLRLSEYGAIVIGSPQNLETSSNPSKAKEDLKTYVNKGGNLITTGKAWKTINQTWPGKLEKRTEESGSLCMKPTSEGEKKLNITGKKYSVWLENESPILKKGSNDVMVFSKFQKNCPSISGSLKCSDDPKGTSNFASMMGFKYGRGIVVNSVPELDDQLGCSINDTEFFEPLVGKKEIYHAVSGGDSSCVVNPRREYGGSVDIAFIVDRSSSMKSPNMCSNIENIVGELESVGINVRYKVYGLPEGPDVKSWAKNKGISYSNQLNQKHFTTKTTVDYPCVEEKTEWPDDIAFHPLKDAKTEGWGPGTLYALDNFMWRGYAEKMVIVLGDQDPTGGCNGRMWTSMGCKNTDCQSYSVSAGLSSEEVNKNSSEEGEFEPFSTKEGKKKYMELCTNCERDWHCGLVPFYFANPWRKEPGKKCKGSSGGKLDSEVQVMNKVVTEALPEDVSVFFLQRKEYILMNEYEAGSPGKLDYLESMEKVAEETEGRVYSFRNWAKIVDYLKDRLRVIKVDEDIEPCPNVDFTFGERGVTKKSMPGEDLSGGSSMGVSLDGKAVYTYPVQIMQSDELRIPGRIELELRKGDLETLSGAINKVYTLGKKKEQDFSETFRVDLESEAFIDEVKFQKIAKIPYILSGGEYPGEAIDVDEDLRVGVNGVEIFKDDDKMHTDQPNAKYKGMPIIFEAAKGESLQVIAKNYNAPRMKLSPLYLHCCGGKKQKISEGVIVNNHTNPEEYEERGIVFFHNFTTIDIGRMDYYREKGVCIKSGSEKSCVDLKPGNINSIRLSPGNHYLKIKYHHPQGVVQVIK